MNKLLACPSLFILYTSQLKTIKLMINQKQFFYLIFLVVLLNCKSYASVGEGISDAGMLTSIPTATLSFLTDGPKSDSVDVPKNGKGYAYILFKTDYDVIITIEDTFNVNLENPNKDIYNCEGMFLADTLLRITFDNDLFGGEQNLTLSTPKIITIRDEKYCIEGDSVSISIKMMDPIFVRTWDVFAGKSAGISGLFGSAGLGASASEAKLSVKGVGGVGFQIQLDEKNNLFLDRRMEKGVSVSLEIPSVNAVVDEVKFTPGFHSEVISKILLGQRFSFSDLGIGDDKKRMAQAGFMLETLSVGGVGISPTVGIVIKAIVYTLNTLGGVNETFDNALLTNYGGLGIEGSLGYGLQAELGPLKFKALDASASFALNAKLSSHQRKMRNVSHKYANRISAIGTSINITQALSFQFSAFSLAYGFNDNVELSSGNFALFDAGIGGEASLGADFDNSGSLDKFSVNLKGGYNVVLEGDSRNDYYNTNIEFPKEYATILTATGKGLAGLFTSDVSVPIGTSMIADAVSSMDLAIEKYIKDKPIKITTIETKGQGFDLSLGISLDLALGVGAGLSIGVTGKYFDEIEYPRKYSEIHSLRKNYLIYSSDYTEEMGDAQLSDIMRDLFSGTIPLVKEAFLNLSNILENVVDAGKEFILTIGGLNGALIGKIGGIPNKSGTWFATTFSSESPMMWKKPFEEPRFRRMYYSSQVKHKTIIDSRAALEEVMTTLVIVSESMNLSFTPEGSTNPIDSVEAPIFVKMIIDEQKLVENEFSIDDKPRVKIYRYDINTLSWILEGGSLLGDTVSVDITKLGTFALGIELTNNVDNIKPEIYEKGPEQGSIQEEYPEIFGKIRDDKYGGGISLVKSHIILNGDTLNISYDPANEKIYYQLSNLDSLENGTMNIIIVATDINNNSTQESFTFQLNVTAVREINLPAEYRLFQNYPNPFNPSTTISFEIPELTDVLLNIYDIQGGFIRTIIQGKMNAGLHYMVWDGKNNFGNKVVSGIYFYQLKSDKINIVKKMQLLK